MGRLLAAIAGANAAKTIIDPMVGSGDLLCSCLAVGAKPKKLVGLELDPLAFAKAEGRLGHIEGAHLVLGDAFSATLPLEQFDLVITNPPYIRYQARGAVDGVNTPSSEDVRAGVIRAINGRRGLSDEARALLEGAAETYPGTSDVAVPAWILSSALVKENGVLAVVAPQAWFSRDYAHVIRKLLDEAFDVEVIVEDGDASWFNDAQVRTHLVVARRRPIGARIPGSRVVLARATAELNSGGILRGSLPSDRAVAAELREVVSKHSIDVTTGLTANVEQDMSIAAVRKIGHVPTGVASITGVALDEFQARTLESYGWRAGQGLRTGANDFFYVDLVDGAASPASRWGIRTLDIPPECLFPAVRRQAELGAEFGVVDATSLSSRVVQLRGWVTGADKRRMAAAGDIRVLPDDVARWIGRVAKSPMSDKEPTKLFPNLAAVAPNCKTDRSGRPTAFWYQLPDFTPRHRPQAFVGRVCGGQPMTYANYAGAVIDANFCALWPTHSMAIPTEVIVAVLHSSWVWAILEETCTVLGGGALKLEATDLRRIPLPPLNAHDINHLAKLGSALLKRRTDDVVKAIDTAVVNAISPDRLSSNRAVRLRSLAENALRQRSGLQ